MWHAQLIALGFADMVARKLPYVSESHLFVVGMG